MGVMAGTLDLIQRGYLGTTIQDATLHFDPRQTERLKGLSPHALPRNAAGGLTRRGEVRISTQGNGRGGSVKIGVGDEVRELRRGDRHAFPAAKPASNRA
jgi:trehalose/maltose hydrolase-like predicted phosphorylase